MAKRTKQFIIEGCILESSVLLMRQAMKANSAKQVEQRYMHKYSGILLGAWHFVIKSAEGVVVREFNIGDVAAAEPTINQQDIFNAESNKKVNDDVKPMTINRFGKERLIKYHMKVNGAWEYWDGRGRRPKWLEEYISSDADLDAITRFRSFFEIFPEFGQ
jgi:hypothetical protein